jgi:hypothetical protein
VNASTLAEIGKIIKQINGNCLENAKWSIAATRNAVQLSRFLRSHKNCPGWFNQGVQDPDPSMQVFTTYSHPYSNETKTHQVVLYLTS